MHDPEPAVLSPEVADAGCAGAAGLPVEVAAQVVWGTNLPSRHKWVNGVWMK